MDMYIQLKQANEEIHRLRNENARLKEELKQLKSLNFSPLPIINTDSQTVTKHSTSKEKLDLYVNLFRGRMDVFAKRWGDKNGRSGYSPVCTNEWIITFVVNLKLSVKIVITVPLHL
ncbi:hypothetical protein J2S74_004181 [Evansella vedderi]|uniref:TOTE conflict system primase domain-containing protein n=1 Tax=Evansella vedderi TaxID=38282 RepID=A0ABT9ZZT1_9BACI|nr:hypothetical protein [Evansella vedderi]MDQ0256759.1 hypothetical protein [Evansella vedderi]